MGITSDCGTLFVTLALYYLQGTMLTSSPAMLPVTDTFVNISNIKICQIS